jgi:uncharacterized membrane protein required for colicin V production
MTPYLLDGILLAFLLVLLLLGLRDGFFKMLGRLLTTIVSLIVTLLLIGPATRIINGIPFVSNLAMRLSDGILAPLRKTVAGIPEIIAGFNLPPFLEKLMLTELSTSDPAGAVRYENLSALIARFTLTALLFLLIFAATAILIRSLAHLLTRLVNELPILGLANRLAGGAAGLAYGLVLVSIAMLLLGLAAPVFPKVISAVENTFLLDYLYRHNLLLLLF